MKISQNGVTDGKNLMSHRAEGGDYLLCGGNDPMASLRTQGKHQVKKLRNFLGSEKALKKPTKGKI